MVPENPLRVALLVVAVVLADSTCSSVMHAESFDKPIRKTVVDLGPSSYLMPNNPSRIELSCFYYPDLMVKELNDPGVKGVLWVTMTPFINKNPHTCQLAHASTERFMAKLGWRFEGVKGPLMFLEPADGDGNGGRPFRVLDMKTGRKIFEDSTQWNDRLEFAHAPDGSVSLRYLRAVGGDCSIPKGGMSCWIKFSRHYGLLPATVPECTGYRRKGDKELNAGDLSLPPQEITTPSAIAYPVAVELSPRPSIKAIPGPVRCTPVM
jgi:hypothetical protein